MTRRPMRATTSRRKSRITATRATTEVIQLGCTIGPTESTLHNHITRLDLGVAPSVVSNWFSMIPLMMA
jgi:hypothetical protein